MFVDIHVEPYEIKKQVEYTIEFPEYGKFPIMQINRGSYIAGAKIETSLIFMFRMAVIIYKSENIVLWQKIFYL